MKRFFAGILTMALAAGMLAGCSVTQVHVCPPQEGTQETDPSPVTAAEGSVKTGLAVITSLDGSAGASGDEPGSAAFDVTLAAVTVDDAGVIDSCVSGSGREKGAPLWQVSCKRSSAWPINSPPT